MKSSILFFSLLFSVLLFGQETKVDYDTLVVKTNYYGKNIFVKNPFHSADELGFTCKKVIVNGEEVKADLDHSAFEIKLGDRKEGEEINIKIVYRKGSKPDILNLKRQD